MPASVSVCCVFVKLTGAVNRGSPMATFRGVMRRFGLCVVIVPLGVIRGVWWLWRFYKANANQGLRR